MSERPRTDGRPDFRDHNFGRTWVKRFPPYVYSLQGGLLVHRVLRVAAWWYVPARPDGECLERLPSPRITFHTACGQMFYGGVARLKRAQTCAVPKPGAVGCGRCVGTGPVFPYGLPEMKARRREARERIGCVVEVEATA